MPTGILHLFCGKIAAGKSTRAARLAEAPDTVLLSEDHFLSTLFPNEIVEIEDYRDRSARLERTLGPHIASLLAAGVNVVLDFQANTRRRREWMKGILGRSNAGHVLHLLDVPDEVCKARLRERNAAGSHAYRTSDEQYDRMMSHFEAPGEDEGFRIVVER